MSFNWTEKQDEGIQLISSGPTHVMLYGGSRSGKTFEILWVIATRALAAELSRHAVLRYRFNHVKASIILDTWPKMMGLCYPDVGYRMDKSDWYAEFPNGAQVWFGGLDEKERTEKVLGQEYVTIFLNECSQIPYSSRNIALTRLAQKATYKQKGGRIKIMRRLMLYDENPPATNHWTYHLFEQKRDPETLKPMPSDDYGSLQMNPRDNLANLPGDYLATLEQLPARMKLRFMEGRFADATEGALWTLDIIETWREYDKLPDMQRIVVAVDPSGADDEDSPADEIGIAVCGLGVDGYGYLLEDLSMVCGPAKWGKIATQAYERWDADRVVAERNFGGAMVKHTIQTARPDTPYSDVYASRGKVVRAEPVSALHETGKIRFAGKFVKLENELLGFTTRGYVGEASPNRADAFIWGMSYLFPGIVKKEKKAVKKRRRAPALTGPQGWMS